MFNQNEEKAEVKWINVGGLNLHSLYIPHSLPKNALPIVLICGLGISNRYMIPAAIELAEKFNVSCPDLPGFGKSDKPDQALNISGLAVALDAFLQESKISRATIVGHSFGCQIGIEFALRFPEKVERLVLAAPSGDPCVNSAFSYFGRLMFDSFLEPFSLIPIAISDYFRAGLIRGFRTFQFALEDHPEDKLPQIDIPTLVIRGAKDPIVSADWVKQITRLLPHSHLVTIEDAAHAVNYNSPKAFTKVICEFVQGELFLKRTLFETKPIK
jgi:2-hydroxy-6-oxonona-2,4-dienedioate hydrolase